MLKTNNIFNNLNSDTRKIFNVIQKNGPVTKNDISHMTGLKLTTLIRLMQPLEELGLIVQSSIGDSTGGRKPVLYDVNSNRYYIIGIDISRTYTQIIASNLKMEIIYKHNFNMDRNCSPEETVRRIGKAVEAFSKKSCSGSNILLGAGIGTVGPMNRDEGILLDPVNFKAPGWKEVPLKAMMEKQLECPVMLDNGANAAVHAEAHFGMGRGLKNVAYFNLGIGIRTGVISSGVIIRTLNDAEDAFGHMVIDVDGEECGCGNCGCIECYSSIFSITRRFVSEIRKGRITVITKSIEQINYADICKAANEGDPLAREVLGSSAEIMGTGLANFINLLNPSLVILSGPLVYHSDMFYQNCAYTASRKCCAANENAVVFNRGGLFKENAISVGSAALVIENYLGLN